jgi:HAD superfamily hydrolase (TIGR01549 family)
MVQFLLIDLFRVLLFPKDRTYFGDLDPLYDSKSKLDGFTFSDHFEFNTQLLEYLRSLTPQVGLYLYTAATRFLSDPEAKAILDPLFQSIYSTSDLGMRKTDTESFQLICSNLKAIPRDVLYIGDNAGCVEAALRAGIQALHYSTNSQIISSIKTQINA